MIVNINPAEAAKTDWALVGILITNIVTVGIFIVGQIIASCQFNKRYKLDRKQIVTEMLVSERLKWMERVREAYELFKGKSSLLCTYNEDRELSENETIIEVEKALARLRLQFNPKKEAIEDKTILEAIEKVTGLAMMSEPRMKGYYDGIINDYISAQEDLELLIQTYLKNEYERAKEEINSI